MGAPDNPRLKPAALQPGDTVGIVAPASPIKRHLLEAGCEALRRLGYKPFYLDSIFDRDLYFAGSVKRRARELEEMFCRDEVKAILCARGGYGCNYLLPELDIDLIATHPKIFAGYSDVTSLLTWFQDTIGLVAFHAPMVTADFAKADGVDPCSWKAAISGCSQWTIRASGMTPLAAGTAEGILYGGCLSMLVASLGTPFAIRTEGAVLLIEDIGVKPYQLDRMLMQLKLAGKLHRVCGIVFGEMLDCGPSEKQDFTLQEVILRAIGDTGVPIAFGLRTGHVSRENVTLPIGVRVRLSVGDEAQLNVLESATAERDAMNVAADRTSSARKRP